jgi:hypothetical protein
MAWRGREKYGQGQLLDGNRSSRSVSYLEGPGEDLDLISGKATEESAGGGVRVAVAEATYRRSWSCGFGEKLSPAPHQNHDAAARLKMPFLGLTLRRPFCECGQFPGSWS